MKVLGLDISITKPALKVKTVNCFHCGRNVIVKIENVRAYNYCSEC